MATTYRVEYTRDDGTVSPVNGTPTHMSWHVATDAGEAAMMVERAHAGWKDITITSSVVVGAMADERWNTEARTDRATKRETMTNQEKAKTCGRLVQNELDCLELCDADWWIAVRERVVKAAQQAGHWGRLALDQRDAQTRPREKLGVVHAHAGENTMRTNRAKVCDVLKVSATHPERREHWGTIVAVRHEHYMRLDVYEEPNPDGKVIERMTIDGLTMPQLRRILTAIARP